MDFVRFVRQYRIASDPVLAAQEHAVNSALLQGILRSRIVVLSSAVALLLVLSPAPVSAHTQLLATTPENGSIVPIPPEAVEFQFNEPVEPVPEGFVLLDQEGTESAITVVPQRNRVQIQLPDAMGQGTYVLGWRVISADGHPISGAITFSIGVESAVNEEGLAHQEDQTVERLSSITRGLTYLGLLVAAGLLLFQLVVLPSVPKPPRSMDRLATVAALLAMLSGAAGLPLTVARQQGLGLGVLQSVDNWFDAIDTHEARAFGALFLSLLVALTLIWFGDGSKAEKRLVVGAVIVALISPTLSGHTNTYDPRWVLRLSNSLHTITGAFWIGGLIGLVLLMRALARGTADDQEATSYVTQAVVRFSTLGSLLLVSVAVTGTVNGWIILDSLEQMTSTDYGRLLMVKIGAVVTVILIAAWNRYRLVPAIQSTDIAAKARQRLRNFVAAEAIILLGVALVTGFLVGQSPLESASAAPSPEIEERVTFDESLGSGHITGSIEPAAVGESVISFSLMDDQMQPLDPIDPPTVLISLPSADLGPIETEAVETGTPGAYDADVRFAASGTWQVTVHVRVSRFEEQTATFEVEIP